jgi:hypothetical protein
MIVKKLIQWKPDNKTSKIPQPVQVFCTQG